MAAEKTGGLNGLGTLSAIVGLFVTLNTLLSTCSDRDIERAKAYRDAISVEEQYWGGLYSRYLDASAKGGEGGQNVSGEMMSIALLSERRLDDFVEFQSFGKKRDDQSKKGKHLEQLRATLRNALRKWAELNPDEGQEVSNLLANQETNRVRQFDSEADLNEPPPVTAEEVRATEAIRAAQIATVLPEQLTQDSLTPRVGSDVLTVGVSNGWDVDVFWCTGPANSIEGSARANYALASEVGVFLAESGAENKELGSQVPIGRVRLRSLSSSAQATGRFATDGSLVVYDIGDDIEKRAAEAILAQIKGTVDSSFGLRRSRSVTKWYISIFVCSTEPES